MRNSKIVIVGLFVASSLMLAACSQQNTLQKQDKKTTVAFLIKAAQSAEGKLKLSQIPNGGFYRVCMEGQLKKSTCEAVYKDMLEYAKTTKDFKGLTLKELTDQKFWSQIQDDYSAVSLNTI